MGARLSQVLSDPAAALRWTDRIWKRIMTESDEDRLLQRAVTGDAVALGQLLCVNGAELEARAAGLIKPSLRALLGVEDVLQTTYIEAFLQIGTFRPHGDGSFLAWLTRIAKNNIVDAARGAEAQKREPAEKRIRPNSDESYARLLSSIADSTTTPSGIALQHESRSLLEDAILRLPEIYQKVIRRYYLEELSVPEIAQELGKSAPAVHMLRARAFDQLCRLVSESQFFGRSA